MASPFSPYHQWTKTFDTTGADLFFAAKSVEARIALPPPFLQRARSYFLLKKKEKEKLKYIDVLYLYFFLLVIYGLWYSRELCIFWVVFIWLFSKSKLDKMKLTQILHFHGLTHILFVQKFVFIYTLDNSKISLYKTYENNIDKYFSTFFCVGLPSGSIGFTYAQIPFGRLWIRFLPQAIG